MNERLSLNTNMDESEFSWKSWKLRPRVLGAAQGPPSGGPEKYEIWGFPNHPEMKIFILFLGIKVLMSTSNFMIFQGVEYYKTENATNTLDLFPIMHVSALFYCCFQLTLIPFLMHWMHISVNNSSSAVLDIKKFWKPNL